MRCAFIGHHDFDARLMSILKNAIKKLISDQGVNEFYVGNHGNFDSCALSALRELKKEFPYIKYRVVLAYLNSKHDTNKYSPEETIVFENFEKVPLKFALSRRNEWLINNADYLITYIVHTHSDSGAAVFARKAERKNKICINIAKI